MLEIHHPLNLGHAQVLLKAGKNGVLEEILQDSGTGQEACVTRHYALAILSHDLHGLAEPIPLSRVLL